MAWLTARVFGAMPNIGMPTIQIGFIDITRTGPWISRSGGSPTIRIILNGSTTHSGASIQFGRTALMTSLISGVMRTGGASAILDGSMRTIRAGRSLIRAGFARTTPPILTGSGQTIGATIRTIGIILTKATGIWKGLNIVTRSII